ncbi:glycosyltransferase family 2 protein [Paludibacter jiangxiensis]|uniref:Glycosyl transferase family 2 n=1 Tax=Paludibacter jiangxiensis TaxID=681398 RepID=A0A170ZNN0_9BACT|nr:glycosyltransferase family 2 protein [Paludibacter jiangxiensis]GAT62862.1 glycosyl transferase family 2 [Paludibacter jiangxiensis]
MCKLSIISINRNNADGLRKTIESVVSQTFTDFEYIVIDGASTDGSVDIIKQYSGRITYWVSEPDKGIYNAMNKGILKATGEYCLFLNSGDWLVNENILSDIKFYQRIEDIIYGNLIYLYNDKDPSTMFGIIETEITFYNFFATQSIPHQAAFIKRALFEKYGLYDESYSVVSDWLFFVKTIIFGNVSLKYININITNFDPYGISSLSHTYTIEGDKAMENTLPSRILKDYENFKYTIEENIELKKNIARLNHRFKLLDKLITYAKKQF